MVHVSGTRIYFCCTRLPRGVFACTANDSLSDSSRGLFCQVVKKTTSVVIEQSHLWPGDPQLGRESLHELEIKNHRALCNGLIRRLFDFFYLGQSIPADFVRPIGNGWHDFCRPDQGVRKVSYIKPFTAFSIRFQFLHHTQDCFGDDI